MKYEILDKQSVDVELNKSSEKSQYYVFSKSITLSKHATSKKPIKFILIRNIQSSRIQSLYSPAVNRIYKSLLEKLVPEPSCFHDIVKYMETNNIGLDEIIELTDNIKSIFKQSQIHITLMTDEYSTKLSLIIDARNEKNASDKFDKLIDDYLINLSPTIINVSYIL